MDGPVRAPRPRSGLQRPGRAARQLGRGGLAVPAHADGHRRGRQAVRGPAPPVGGRRDRVPARGPGPQRADFTATRAAQR
jgi:hypothetical protein